MQYAVLFTLFMSIDQCIGLAVEDGSYPNNSSGTRTTLSGLAEYRAALTLDWLAAEDTRQRELALAFETEAAPSVQIIASDCISYPKPATGKVARLMLELLKNLEGDEAVYIPELTQGLVRAKLLVETSMLEAEPDLEALVKTPSVMMGEPHTTFPRILSMVWMTATDPSSVNKYGWCSISRIAKYLMITSPTKIAQHMRNLDPVIARARFIMEEFIQHVTPNMYDKKNHHIVRTTPMIEHTAVGRTNLHIHAESKVRPSWIKGFTATTGVTTTRKKTTVLDPYEEIEHHKHVLVSNPNLEEIEKKSAAETAQFSVCLLFCNWTVIALSLVMRLWFDIGVTSQLQFSM